MPYRDECTGEACHQCERPASDRCPCCTRATCKRHLLDDKRMCGRCDEAYYRFTHREDQRGTLAPAVVVTGIAAVPWIISATLLPVTFGVALLGFPAIMLYRKARDRRDFVQQMRTRGALDRKAGPNDPTEEDLRLAAYDRRLTDRHAEQVASVAADEPVEPPQEPM